MLVKGRGRRRENTTFRFLSLSMKECSRGVAGKKKRMEEAHKQTI